MYKKSTTKSDQYNNELYSLIKKNSFYVILNRSLVPIFNFFITIYIIRKLTVNNYGIYNILFAIMGYISLFSSFGLPNIFRRYIPEFYEKKQISNIKYIVKKGSIFRFIFSFSFIVIMIIFSKQIENLFKLEEASKYLAIFSITVVFTLQANLFTIALNSMFQQKKCLIANISFTIFRAGNIYLVLKMQRGLIGLIIADAISCVFLFVLVNIFLKKSMNEVPAIRVSKNDFPLKRIARFGTFDFFNEMGSQVLNKSTDYFIVSAFLNPSAVGLYAFADRLIKQLSKALPMSFFRDLIYPIFFTKYTQNNDFKSLNWLFNFLTKISTFFAIPLFIWILILGDKIIIYIFDLKYIDALPVLIIFASLVALNAFLYPIGLVVKSIERVEINLYSKIFAIYNLILDIIVVKRFGIIGIAVVTSTALLFKDIFIFKLARRYVLLNICWSAIIKISINSLIMGTWLFTLEFLIKDFYSFILISLGGLIIYFIVSYFNRVFNTAERKTINKILPKPIFVF